MELVRDRLEPDPRAEGALRIFDPSLSVRWDPLAGCLCVYQKTGQRRLDRETPERIVYMIRTPGGEARQIELYDLEQMRREREGAPGSSWALIKRRNKEAREKSEEFVRERNHREMVEATKRSMLAQESRTGPGHFYDLAASARPSKGGRKRILVVP